MPDADTKGKDIIKCKDLDYKTPVLAAKKKKGGIVAVLELNINISYVDKNIVETDNFTAAITERLNGLYFLKCDMIAITIHSLVQAYLSQTTLLLTAKRIKNGQTDNQIW